MAKPVDYSAQINEGAVALFFLEDPDHGHEEWAGLSDKARKPYLEQSFAVINASIMSTGHKIARAILQLRPIKGWHTEHSAAEAKIIDEAVKAVRKTVETPVGR